MPGMGDCADPGFVAVMPGSAEIMMPPVSVCHHVSTTGTSPPPMTSRYQRHASGLMGSPTEPSRRMEERSRASGISRPVFMKERIAVGAAYRIVTPCFSTMSHQRPGSGVSGVPS